jgi:hypothetical protein
MADQEEQVDKLSHQDEVMLNLIRQSLNYREIGQILGIAYTTAHQWGSAARKHFAELKHIPLEALNLDRYKRNPGGGPHISDEEQQLLDAHFEQLYSSIAPLPPNFEEKILKKLFPTLLGPS